MNLRASYEARQQSSCQTPETHSIPMSPTPENSEFPGDDELNMQTMDFSHLNKLNKLSDLTITEDLTEEELINMYKDSEVLEEQADLLHYLFYNK